MINLNMHQLLEGKRPFPRYAKVENEIRISGETIRKIWIVPNLKYGNILHIDLSGYHLYSKKFLRGCFGDLILEDNFEYEFIKKRMTYNHSRLTSYNTLIDGIILEAHNEWIKSG